MSEHQQSGDEDPRGKPPPVLDFQIFDDDEPTRRAAQPSRAPPFSVDFEMYDDDEPTRRAAPFSRPPQLLKSAPEPSFSPDFQLYDDDDKTRRAEPHFRSAQLLKPASEPTFSAFPPAQMKLAPQLKSEPVSYESASLIDKDDYFRDRPEFLRKDREEEKPLRWNPQRLRLPPAFYPLEKSTRLVEGCDAKEIAGRISECLRTLSVYAVYDHETATASLVTAENVEMHLSLWQPPNNKGVLVELQRRKGDSIAFHRYSRTILDAAVVGGDLDAMEPWDDVMYSKKVQRLLALEMRNKELDQGLEEHENAIIAIEIAHGLLTKDRIDACQLGLESLCLLTDPRKTGFVTAVLTAHVVLLGSTHGVEVGSSGFGDEHDASAQIMANEGPFQEIREKILSLVQFSRLGEEDMDEDASLDCSIDKEHKMLLHNLALAVLANALDVIENSERFEDEPEDTKPRARLRTSSSNDVAKEFINQSQDTEDILSTLISELGKADRKPHNAALSAKCLGSLIRASDDARERAKKYNAKEVVATALEVGVRTHLKLETECKKVASALEAPRTEDL